MDSVHLFGGKMHMKMMKSILTFAIGLAAISATAQKAENDDMYFTSKDRVKKNTAAAVAPNSKVEVKRSPYTQNTTPQAEKEVGINPTDSYSARNVNPEYVSGNTGTKSKETGDYFIENYNPTGVNGNLNGNYSSSSPSPYTGVAPYSNPYAYGYSPYSSYGYRGYNPYMSMNGYGYPGYGSGLSMSMGTSFGYNPMMYGNGGMGMGYGYSSAWGNPYAMYNPFYDPFYDPFYSMNSMAYRSCPYSFYGYNSYGYGGYASPGAIDGSYSGRDVAYQRRTDRSSATNFQPDDETRTNGDIATRNSRQLSSGRTRGTEGTQSYYEKGWRSNTDAAGAAVRSQWRALNSGTNSGSTNSGTTGFDNSGRTNSSWGGIDNGSSLNDGGGQPRSSWAPSSSGGGGSRSSSFSTGTGGGGSVGGGGGGGARTRGRD